MARRFDRARHLQRISAGMLAPGMTGHRTDREKLGIELSREMASIRAYLDEAV